MNYYQFHIADWALHTSHLSLEEEAVYRRLLDYYYDTEAPIPRETKWVIRRLRLVPHKEIVLSILQEFFVLQDDGWHNLRADREIEKWNNRGWFPSDPCVTTLRPGIDEWKRTIRRIHARDNYTCQYCGQVGGIIEVDHIFPVSRGGSNKDDNLCSACRRCNRAKSNKLLTEWRGF